MTTLHIDFETYSAAELPVCGTDNYASHPTTGVHCMAWALGDGKIHVDRPQDVPMIPLMEHVIRGGEVVAHNAAFELAIWNKVCVPKYGWLELKPEQVRCTMAQCYAMSLPGSLERAAAALGVTQRKDMAGQRVMLQLAKPKTDGTFWTPQEAPEKFQRLYDYCKQDVEVEREIDKRTLRLSPREQKLWLLDYKINQRGIYVDLPSIKNALAMVDSEKARLDKAMLRATGGVVGKCTEVKRLVEWIRSQGVELAGVAKSDVLDALVSDNLPVNVREALELRKEAAKSSTAKLLAMQNRASADSRVRGCFQYHGASTGRWAHRGIQPGNLPRPRVNIKPKNVHDMIDMLKNRDLLDMTFGPVMDALADCVRGMICAAPNYELIAMDFSAIEARDLAWLAGEESVLKVFRTHGKIYEHAASGIYNKPIEAVTKDERQIGKVAELALGFGGGVGAFQSMARAYGVKVDDTRADVIKSAWRSSHPAIVRYWYDLENAAINAVELDEVCEAGARGREVLFKKSGSFLWCRLPSGRALCYPYPEVREVQTPWGETKTALTFMTELDATQRKKLASKIVPDAASAGNWVRLSTYGGSLAENVTQAVARDLLADAMLRLDDNGFPVVMHVHDEAVIEIPASSGSSVLHEAEQIMSVVPAWAEGLPLACEGWRAFRYRK